jgi:hypothetical protein
MRALTKAYLLLYNLCLASQWTIILLETVLAKTAEQVYDKTWPWLRVAQTLAALEVVHAFVGIVNSPAHLTFVQVFSRVWTTWAVLFAAPETRPLGPDLWSVKDRCEVVMPSLVDHRSRQVPVLLL